MGMDISDFTKTAYVRKPFEVLAVEVTTDNIEDLAEFIGELAHKDGSPYIQSDKKLVGNQFRVWPGFYVTLLNGKVRCYSRRVFFEQFAKMSLVENEVAAILNAGNVAPQKERLFETPSIAPKIGDIAQPSRCEHGAQIGHCVYKNCAPVTQEEG